MDSLPSKSNWQYIVIKFIKLILNMPSIVVYGGEFHSV